MNRSRRKLALSAETIRQLQSDELSNAVGGKPKTGTVIPKTVLTCDVLSCVLNSCQICETV